jgi:Flp pilus assembly protein TadD
LALELDPKNKSAVAGLAAVYAELGKVALALHFEAKVRGYREANPYFHFAHAREAYDGQRYKESLRAINMALRKQPGTGAFYFMKALAQLQLEDPAGARRSLERAERYGRYKDLLRRYGADLTRLTEQWVSVR